MAKQRGYLNQAHLAQVLSNIWCTDMELHWPVTWSMCSQGAGYIISIMKGHRLWNALPSEIQRETHKEKKLTGVRKLQAVASDRCYNSKLRWQATGTMNTLFKKGQARRQCAVLAYTPYIYWEYLKPHQEQTESKYIKPKKQRTQAGPKYL